MKRKKRVHRKVLREEKKEMRAAVQAEKAMLAPTSGRNRLTVEEAAKLQYDFYKGGLLSRRTVLEGMDFQDAEARGVDTSEREVLRTAQKLQLLRHG